MKYEIIKDKEDLYVLSINSIVVLITRDLSRITDEIEADAADRKKNPKRVYNPAELDVKIEETHGKSTHTNNLFDL